MLKRLLVFIVLLACSVQLRAATITARSCQYGDVVEALGFAGTNGTVILPDGQSTWQPTQADYANILYLQRGITIKSLHGRDSTKISGVGAGLGRCLFYALPVQAAITNDEVIRIEGITFDGLNTMNALLRCQGGTNAQAKPFNNLVVVNCRFQNMVGTCSDSGALNLTKQVRGAAYGNEFINCNVIVKAIGNNDSGQECTSGNFPFAYGSNNNFMFENNTVKFQLVGGLPYGSVQTCAGWIESGQGGRITVRYNTWDTRNAIVTELWDIHGAQNWGINGGGNGQTSTMIVEYYGNTIINAPTFRMINHRGSWGLFHNNYITGTTNPTMALHASEYDKVSDGGSGCHGYAPSPPPRNYDFDAVINNTYVFNNTMSGVIQRMTRNTDLDPSCGILDGVNFRNDNSGVTMGTTTPSGTCTNGQMYWKASSTTPPVTSSIIQNSRFYQCESGGWVDKFGPPAYPDTRVFGSGTPSPTPTATATATASPPSPTPTPTPTPTPIPGVILHTNWTVTFADSEETVAEGGQPKANVKDDNTSTMWHTQWQCTQPCPVQPHELQVNLGRSYNINGFKYLPRQDGAPYGRIKGYTFYVSTDGTTWGTAVSTGNFPNANTEQRIDFTTKTGQYVRLVASSAWDNDTIFTAIAELNVLEAVTTPTPTPSVTPTGTPTSTPTPTPTSTPTPTPSQTPTATPPGTYAGIVEVLGQRASTGPKTGDASNKTYPLPVHPGNLLVVAGATSGDTTQTSVQVYDSAGSQWTVSYGTSSTTTTTNTITFIAWAIAADRNHNGTAYVDVVVVNPTGSNSKFSWSQDEFSGVTGAGFSQINTNNGTDTGTMTASTSGQASTSTTADLRTLFVSVMTHDNTTVVTSPGSGYTLMGKSDVANSTSQPHFVMFLVDNSDGTSSAYLPTINFTAGAAVDHSWSLQSIAFQNQTADFRAGAAAVTYNPKPSSFRGGL